MSPPAGCLHEDCECSFRGFTNRMQAQVAAFHFKFGQPIGLAPNFSRAELRARLILEEAAETVIALVGGANAQEMFDELVAPPGDTKRSLVEAADGMCDTLYVTFGAAAEMGIDLAPLFDEVHRTNMAKVGGPTRGDGKILKPDGWQKPRIAELLKAQGWT